MNNILLIFISSFIIISCGSNNGNSQINKVTKPVYYFHDTVYIKQVPSYSTIKNGYGSLIDSTVYQDKGQIRLKFTYPLDVSLVYQEVIGNGYYMLSEGGLYKYNEFKNKTIAQYDQIGNKINLSSYNGEKLISKYNYVYDNKRNKTEEQLRDSKDNLILSNSFKHDSNGRLIETFFINNEQQRNYKTTYEYSKNKTTSNIYVKNQLITSKTSTYNNENLLIKEDQHKAVKGYDLLDYDSNKRIIKRSFYDLTNKLINSNVYKYDDNDNVIELLNNNCRSTIPIKENYSYNKHGYITEATIVSNRDEKKSFFTYDNKGNIIEAITKIYKGPNKYYAEKKFIFKYSNKGELVEEKCTFKAKNMNNEVLKTYKNGKLIKEINIK